MNIKVIALVIVAFLVGLGAMYLLQNSYSLNISLGKPSLTSSVAPTMSTQVSPTVTVTNTAITPGTSPTSAPDEKKVVNGSISGTLGYPSNGIPPLAVYAFTKGDNSKFYFVSTAQNQQNFTIADVPPGTYHVVAYVKDDPQGKLVGGYSKAVPCGLTVDCKDNTLIDVVVLSGQDATGAAVKDWYAPAGSFPSRPQ